MISKGLIELIFSAFSIERWNDHPRTEQFTEMDKQAHKAMIAYFIARDEEACGTPVNWDRLICNGAFSFFHRVLVTDIKPPIFHRLMADAVQQQRLNTWVFKQLEPLLSPLEGDLCVRCREYLESSSTTVEDDILSAAHYIATRWEFKYIYHWSKPFYGIEKTKDEIEDEIKKYRYLHSVDGILDDTGSLSDLISLVGQLRFQKRWAQLHRLPRTSVLGHLLMVALLSWLASIEIGTGSCRRRNDFYAGLFHDLPEVLTRDIISPVKRSVKGLEELIKQLEIQSMEESLLPLVPSSWRDDVLYFVTNEFENRIRTNGKVHIIGRDFTEEEGRDENDPVDGKIVEICDKLSAYIEAKESIRIGIRPPHLEEAAVRIYDKFVRRASCGFSANRLFDYFK